MYGMTVNIVEKNGYCLETQCTFSVRVMVHVLVDIHSYFKCLLDNFES